MVEIVEVKSKKEQRDFMNFPLKMYEDCPYFVPPLYIDEKKMFKPNFVYNETCESVFFLAKQDGKIVGRISGIIQRAANEKNNQKRVRFTRFDSVDDAAVSNALFRAVESWAKARGMDTIVGPLGYSDLEREGLLIEGFEELSTFEEQYNYDYYPKLVEEYGFVKEVDWNERKLYCPDEPDEKLERVSNLMLQKYNLHFAECKNTKEFLDKYIDKFFNLLDETYTDIYGTVPFTDGMKKVMRANFALILDIKYCSVIVDENDDVVCFGISFPAIGEALQKSKGKLTIPAIFRLLRTLKNPKVIDLGLIGVAPQYAQKGVASALTAQMMKYLQSGKIDHMETNLNLEDNMNIQNQWRRFKSVIHKRRRAYVKAIV